MLFLIFYVHCTMLTVDCTLYYSANAQVQTATAPGKSPCFSLHCTDLMYFTIYNNGLKYTEFYLIVKIVLPCRTLQYSTLYWSVQDYTNIHWNFLQWLLLYYAILYIVLQTITQFLHYFLLKLLHCNWLSLHHAIFSRPREVQWLLYKQWCH